MVNGIFRTFSVTFRRECVLIPDRFICVYYPTWSCDVLFYSKQMLRLQAPLISAALTPESLSHVQKYFCVNVKTYGFWAIRVETSSLGAKSKNNYWIPTTAKVTAELDGATLSGKQNQQSSQYAPSHVCVEARASDCSLNTLLHHFPCSAWDKEYLLGMFGCAWFISFDLFYWAQGGRG